MASSRFGITHFDRDRNPSEESGMFTHPTPHVATSWLDSHHPNPPSPPHPELVARFTQVKEHLVDISESVDIRNQLKRIGRNSTKFGLYRPANDDWRRQTSDDERIYNRIRSEVESFSERRFPSGDKLKEWEDKLEPLLERTKNQSNNKASAGFRESKKIDAAGIFQAKADWSWNTAAGKGPGEEEAVSPKEEKMNPHEDAGKYSGLCAVFEHSLFEEDEEYDEIDLVEGFFAEF